MSQVYVVHTAEGRWGSWEQSAVLSRKWSSFLPSPLPSRLLVMAGRVGVRGSLLGSSCCWPPHYFSAFLFLSFVLHVPIVWCPFTSPPLQTQRTTCPCAPRPQAPWCHYPMPAPHCCLLKPFSLPSGPSQTPPLPQVWQPPRSAELLRGLRGALTSCPKLQRQTVVFFTFNA